jgi:peptidoglycan/LPS O-acetylase OafA/YrhL
MLAPVLTDQAQRDRVAVTSAPGAGASRPHADELDVLRPAASLLVIVTHAMQMFAPAGSVFYGAVLLESQASRHIFFFVSALVLMYQAYDRPRWSVWSFWGRRFRLIVVPFIIWTLLYVLAGFAGLRGDTIPSVAGTPLQVLTRVGVQLITGPGHLYFVIVLVQFYLLFPLLAGLLNRARRWHPAIVGVSLAAQVALTFALHYLKVNSLIWQDINATREVTSYGFYLVAGAVIGAHLPAVRAWVWRRRWALGGAALAATAGVEAWYLQAVHSGESPGSASDPFSPEFILSYLAAILLLWLAGAWWAARARGGRLSRLVRTTSDNSFGVYLSHVVFLDVAATYGLGSLAPGVPWPVVVLIAVCGTWIGASLFTAAVTRTPVSGWLVGRARRPLRGGPPPVGRGTVLPPAPRPAVPPPAGRSAVPPPAPRPAVLSPTPRPAVLSPAPRPAVLSPAPRPAVPPAPPPAVPPPAGRSAVPPPAGRSAVPPPAGRSAVPPPAGRPAGLRLRR